MGFPFNTIIIRSSMLLNTATIHLFFLIPNIPLCGYNKMYLSITYGSYDVWEFFLCYKKCFVNLNCLFPGTPLKEFLSYNYLGVELSDHRGSKSSFSQDNAKLVPILISQSMLLPGELTPVTHLFCKT